MKKRKYRIVYGDHLGDLEAKVEQYLNSSIYENVVLHGGVVIEPHETILGVHAQAKRFLQALSFE